MDKEILHCYGTEKFLQFLRCGLACKMFQKLFE